MSFKKILFIIWLIDYVCIWILMFQEFEIEKTYKPLVFGIPSVCKDETKWYKKLLNKLTFKNKKDCVDFYKQQKIDTIWKITPFSVFNRQLETNILIWSNFIGKSISYIANGCTSETSWFFNMYIGPLFPILLIIIYIFFCAITSFILNRKFSFKLFNIASIDFYNSNKNNGKKLKQENTNINLKNDKTNKNVIEEYNIPSNQNFVCKNIENDKILEDCGDLIIF